MRLVYQVGILRLIPMIVLIIFLWDLIDLKNVDKMTFNFDLGTPFRPYQQLMGVLPEASKEHIPLAYRVSQIRRVRLWRVWLTGYCFTGSDV